MTLATGLHCLAQKLTSAARDGVTDAGDPDAVRAVQAVLQAADDVWRRDRSAALLLVAASLLVSARRPDLAALLDSMKDAFERANDSLGSIRGIHAEG
jgi:hypothetical protein